MTISRLDLDDYQDTALAAKAQMEQLNTLFRQTREQAISEYCYKVADAMLLARGIDE